MGVSIMACSLLLTHVCPLACQGHLEAAAHLAGVYYWGQGVAVDYPRAMAAYKVSAEAGLAVCQYQVGCMYLMGYGVTAVDYQQARAWLEKAAAQGFPEAFGQLRSMYWKERA